MIRPATPFQASPYVSYKFRKQLHDNNSFNIGHNHHDYSHTLRGNSHHIPVVTRQAGYRGDSTLDHSPPGDILVVDQLEGKEAGKSQTSHHEEGRAVP